MQVAKATISEYARMRDYWRLVSGKKAEGAVTVEQTGDKLAEGAVIVE